MGVNYKSIEVPVSDKSKQEHMAAAHRLSTSRNVTQASFCEGLA